MSYEIAIARLQLIIAVLADRLEQANGRIKMLQSTIAIQEEQLQTQNRAARQFAGDCAELAAKVTELELRNAELAKARDAWKLEAESRRAA
ncbi:hypothetical protein [Chromobacterium phragmitis]|uniref:hypothetical protein n=1 Tax=Chromobacterium phragmitis TaxID=2202141 RepID=UPI003877AC4B